MHLAVEGSPGLLSDLKSIEDIFREHGLTEREMEIANLMLHDGLGNNEIAEKIYRAPITVKTHVSHIYQKFGVKGRSEFMALFIK